MVLQSAAGTGLQPSSGGARASEFIPPLQSAPRRRELLGEEGEEQRSKQNSYRFAVPRQPVANECSFLGRRQPHNVPPLHSAQAVLDVVAAENRILESVNYELVTYTAADWVCLFEVRFSLKFQHFR